MENDDINDIENSKESEKLKKRKEIQDMLFETFGSDQLENFFI
jgi:hypothetical protein